MPSHSPSVHHVQGNQVTTHKNLQNRAGEHLSAALREIRNTLELLSALEPSRCPDRSVSTREGDRVVARTLFQIVAAG